MSRNASNNESYFVTLTVINWMDVFTRRLYNDFMIENLSYCCRHKGLYVHAYVLMTNHLHMIAHVDEGILGDVLRDFKTYTSKQLLRLIADNPQESRKEWMMAAFRQAGQDNVLNKHYQLWQNGNYPVLIYSPEILQQKINYIHQNPVRAGFVGSAHEYWYSSANPESPLKLG
jgi:putative transposase